MPKLLAIVVVCALFATGTLAEVPADFPKFIVPGQEPAMQSLRELFYMHYATAQPLIPLWDEWMTTGSLWPGVANSAEMQQRWAETLSARPMFDDGYIPCQQHDGTAHSGGWPFPLWHQGAGTGWHFVPQGVPGYEPPLVKNWDGWKLTGAHSNGIDNIGWQVELTEADAMLEAPPVHVDPFHAPFLRLNWRASGLENAKPYVEWATADQPEFSSDRRVALAPAGAAEARTMMTMYTLSKWKAPITRLRISFANPAPAKVTIKSFHTAYDSRHNINNTNFVSGCCNYIAWTGDTDFLKHNIDKMRRAMHYMETEFDTRKRKCVFTNWVGHEGTSGVVWKDGHKQILAGRGIGSDYWDILPFGREDALATLYYYRALNDLADLEQAIAAHPEWNIKPGDFTDLRQFAQQIKDYAGQRFWSEKTGRFTSGIDIDGHQHDYGFTFLNLEAISYDFATRDQALSIIKWLDGQRTVTGDTSQSADIYHWRFGPRATTRRNIDWYIWAWSAPESIAWGDQVQDGGAVLGFTYFDQLARVKTVGPDNAWRRVHAMIDWFDEVQKSGGYQKYYSVPGHGTLQGDNVAGGLGITKEFFESVLATQVMMYGFMGFKPTIDGCEINPNLPGEWPELTITNVRLHGIVMDVKATKDAVELTGRSGSGKIVVNQKAVELAPGTVVRIAN